MRTYQDLVNSTWLAQADRQMLLRVAQSLGIQHPQNISTNNLRNRIKQHLNAQPQTRLPANGPWPQPQAQQSQPSMLVGIAVLAILALAAWWLFFGRNTAATTNNGQSAPAVQQQTGGSNTGSGLTNQSQIGNNGSAPSGSSNGNSIVVQTWSYPLSGQSYSSPQGSLYNAVWTADGRLWQPQLPPGAQRIAHSVAFTIEEGSYAFDGVECQLFVDPTRNGQGSSNPVTAEYGNDLRFVVDTADGGQAYALVECRGNFSSGFQIRWLGPLQ